MGKEQRKFNFRSIESYSVIPLFRYLYSAFYSVPCLIPLTTPALDDQQLYIGQYQGGSTALSKVDCRGSPRTYRHIVAVNMLWYKGGNKDCHRRLMSNFMKCKWHAQVVQVGWDSIQARSAELNHPETVL